MVRQLDPASLTLVDILDYYDQPVLYTCKDSAENMFIALLVRSDAYIERWLYLETPPIIMDALEATRMDLYTAFRQPQTGMLWDARYSRQTNGWAVSEILPSSLKISDLPVPGEFLRKQGE